jgi:hypothetical protein
MEKPGRGLLRVFVALALALVLGTASGAPAQDGSQVELEGTWHVLVHYKDKAAGNPDAERWEDRVWVLRRDGSRLVWSDYPIVAFDNRSGRFGAVAGNPRARVLHYWEPNAVQLAELEHGPKVNSRGSREKRLGPSGDGWRTSDGGGAASAMTITFTANWFIEDVSKLPRFRMEDVMGGAMTESLEGGTVYVTESIEEGGKVLRGRFTRDDTRVGTFRMLRTAPVRGLGTEEEQRERIRGKTRAFFALDALEGTSLSGVDYNKLTEEQREEVRGEIGRTLAAGASASGQRLSRQQLVDLTDRVEELLREGKSLEEIQRMFAEGEIQP